MGAKPPVDRLVPYRAWQCGPELAIWRHLLIGNNKPQMEDEESPISFGQG